MRDTVIRTSEWGAVCQADANGQQVVAAEVGVENGCVFVHGESQQGATVRTSRRREPAACSAGPGEGHADQQQHR